RRRSRRRADRTARTAATERELADRAVGRGASGDGGATTTRVEVAAGEVLDDPVRAVPSVATSADGSGEREVEEGRRQGRGQRGLHIERERIDLGLEGGAVPRRETTRLRLELREAALRRHRAAVEPGLRLLNAEQQCRGLGLRGVLPVAVEDRGR